VLSSPAATPVILKFPAVSSTSVTPSVIILDELSAPAATVPATLVSDAKGAAFIFI